MEYFIKLKNINGKTGQIEKLIKFNCKDWTIGDAKYKLYTYTLNLP